MMTTKTQTRGEVIDAVLESVGVRRVVEGAELEELQRIVAEKARGVKAADDVLFAGRTAAPQVTSNGNGMAAVGSYLSEKMLEKGRRAAGKMPASGFTVKQLGEKMRCSEATARKVIDVLLATGELAGGERRVPAGNQSAQQAAHFIFVAEGAGQGAGLTSNGNSVAASPSPNGAVEPSPNEDEGLLWLRELVKPIVDDRPNQVVRLKELEAAVEEQKEKIKIGDRMGKAAGFPPPASASNGRRKKKKERGVTEATLERAWVGIGSLGGAEFTTRHAGEAATPPLDNTTAKACIEILKAEGRVRLVGERVPVDSDRPAIHYQEVEVSD